MTAIFSVQNLFAWFVQVATISLVGAMLPRLFRIRHPQSQLAYCYLLLATCMAVPFLQPWQHLSGALASNFRLETSAGSNSILATLATVSWNRVIAFALVAGIIVRLGFFVAGILRLRHYRATAVPLQFPKESILSTCKLLQRDVEFGVSVSDIGPVTLGWRRPMILLPDSFLGLEEDAQQAILCHELLHVTRRDWLANVLEELIGACLWFHPGIWYLLNQTKLAREQVVDAEVVRLTAAPERYLAALLAMAGHPEPVSVPAPLFFRNRHFARRMQLLLMDRRPSNARLALSYTAMMMVLVLLGGSVIAAFPLIGAPRTGPLALRTPAAPALPLVGSLPSSGTLPTHSGRRLTQDGREEVVYDVGNGVSTPKVIAKAEPEYSDAARLAKLEGTVVIEGIVMTDGSFGSLNVLRSPGHPELDRSAIRAVEQWKFEPGVLNGKPVPIRLVVELSFNLR